VPKGVFGKSIKNKFSRFVYILGLCVLLLILLNGGSVINFILYGIFEISYNTAAANIVSIVLHAAAFAAVIAVGLKDQKLTLASVCFFKKVKIGVWGAALVCSVGYVLFDFYVQFMFFSFVDGWSPDLGVTEGNFLFNVISIALIPAVAEELLIKGLIFSILKKHYPLIASVIIASLMFAVLHLSIIRIIPLFLTSCYTFWVYLRSGSIILPMFLHFIHNLFAFVLISEPFSHLGTFYAALALFAIGSYLLRRSSKAARGE
jgi:membrane protease YdiL (CAAX protease family)